MKREESKDTIVNRLSQRVTARHIASYRIASCRVVSCQIN